MRAAVITAPRRAELRRLPTPDPGPGEVLVELEGCGVCGSDLPVWQGRPWFDYPRDPGAPGHEGWGRIVALGDGVRGLEVGRRVAAICYRSDAEFDVAAADAVVALPDELDGQPFPGEPLGCAMNVARRCGFAEGQTVAVVGVGFLGALLVQIAARAGARLIALSRRPFALDVARTMGAEHVIGADDDAALQIVQELTGGALCDRVIEVTGKQGPLDLAAQLTRVRGRLVIAGFHQDGPRQVDMQLWNWRGLDVINAHERDPAIYAQGIREAARAVAAGDLDPSPLYTHEFALSDIATALDAASERPDGFLKALVRP
ncbi:MAG TPA: zinc-binding dehydrogenase [Solirubrobacteraceae bacterium]|nr:zinc-binding dehydrogenase [Solirubrobacteraceae bacterium]